MGVVAVLLWLAAIAIGAMQLRIRWPEQKEWSRKFVHIGAAPVLLLIWAVNLNQAISVLAAALITLLAALNYRIRLLPAIEDVERHSYGTIAYAASITLLLWIYWPSNPASMAAGALVMAIGDGLAGLIGPIVQSPRWRIFGLQRSLVGTLSMGLASLCILLLLASCLAESPTFFEIICIASGATLLEQFAFLGLDNLTVPLSVAWLWSQLI